MTIPSHLRVRGELRNWREVYLNECSYIAGQIYNDVHRDKRDGTNFTTGLVMMKIDRGDHWIVKTRVASAFILFKSKELKT